MEHKFSPEAYAAYLPWLRMAFSALLAGGVIAAMFAWRGRRLVAMLILSLVGVFSAQSVVTGTNALAPVLSGDELLRSIARQHGEFDRNKLFFSVGMYDQTLPFYLKRPVTLVAYTDEFEMGIKLEPGKAIADKADFHQRWKQLEQAYAVMRPGTLDEMTGAGLPLVLLGRDLKRVIVRRR
jgi:hypothetical protein